MYAMWRVVHTYFYDYLISLLKTAFFLFILIYSVLLLLHAITAIPTTSLKGNEQRNKKAFNVSQSPITYVKRLESSSSQLHHQPEAKKVVASGGRLKPRTKGKKILDNVPLATRKNIMSNHELLSSLGLSKMPSPSNHHRKRLATQSRHVGRPDDSRIFVVKLPPNPYYYSHMGNKIVGVNEPNAIEEKGKKVRKNSNFFMMKNLNSFKIRMNYHNSIMHAS